MTFYNQLRGLSIHNTGYKYLTQGHNAAVFVDRRIGKVRKLFFCRDFRDSDRYRNIFQSEVCAYKLAQKNPELKIYVPQFYGVKTNNVIIDKHGCDVTQEYCSNFAYDMEFIDGVFEKIGWWNSHQEKEIYNLFRKNGINFLNDCSVYKKDGQIVKVIDFATKEFE